MTIARPTYCTREDVKRAPDVKFTARNNGDIDDAIEAASDAIDGLLHLKFYPVTMTRYWDWPNYQYAPPWKLYFDAWVMADPSTAVVTSGGSLIPVGAIQWNPINEGPPYRWLELDRSTNYAFGAGKTPQRDISITGTWGWSVDTQSAGALAAALNDTTGTAVQITDASLVGVGDNILIGTERMLVTGRANAATGQTQQGSGCATANNADVALTVLDGTQIHAGEVLQLDSERMLAVDVTGNVVTVRRAWDGTVLATHTGATVYAQRLLTVTRGALGTTAATHANGTAVARHLVPGLVRELAIAEAEVNVLQKTGGQARSQGSGDNKRSGIGDRLPDLRAQAVARFGRKMRTRTV